MIKNKLITELLVIMIGVTIVMGVFVIAGVWFERYMASIGNAYAMEWVSLMVVEHIEHSGTWPNRWDALEDDYRRLSETLGEPPYSFEELQQRVGIEFDVTVEALKKYEREAVRVITCREGVCRELQNPTPNGRIWDFLNSQKGHVQEVIGLDDRDGE